ncbi:MAG: thiamine diphosphokinase [candidate division Zixibacteria bacterium]|nr:thiamine diphosphokinase [candidate division Zixibacteria bacterium]
MNKTAAIFLNGTYPLESKKFYISEYKKMARQSFIIAVDGALNFFRDNKLLPHMILGDWDSAGYSKRKLFQDIEVISTPDKDNLITDGELSLQWCVDNNISDVVIYGGIDTVFETDHLMGNIFMMFAYINIFRSIKMRDYIQEIIPIVDGVISGEGNAGENISVVPLSKSIIFEAQGLQYNPRGKKYGFGSSTPLRNQIKNKRFRIGIKGKAVIIQHFR